MDRKQPDEAVPLRGEQCRPEGLNAENSPDGLQATGWGCPPKVGGRAQRRGYEAVVACFYLLLVHTPPP